MLYDNVKYTVIEHPSDAFQQSVSLEHIVAMCKRAFGQHIQVVSVQELSGGGFNNSYIITLHGKKPVVLRVGPTYNAHLASQEQALMHNEQLMQPYFAPIAHLMPKTLMIDFTHQIIERDYLFQTFMQGEQWKSVQDQLTDNEKRILWSQLGIITKQIHTVRGKVFGSLCSSPQFSLWSSVVLHQLEQCINGVEAVGLDTTNIKNIVAIAQTHKAFLDEITQPYLLHGDLWTVNILVKRLKSGPRIVAVLDSDRGLWGDPMADWTIFLLNWHKPKGAEAFWEQYGQIEEGLGANFRRLVYQGIHIGSAFVEAQRLGYKDTLERGYNDLKSIVAQLQSITK